MIDSFKHKGLRQLFEGDNSKGVSAEHVRKLKQILAALQCGYNRSHAVADFRASSIEG
jgi:proteic killer suppression protein